MKIEEIQIILQFMERVDLKGSEVLPYQHCIQALHLEAKEILGKDNISTLSDKVG